MTNPDTLAAIEAALSEPRTLSHRHRQGQEGSMSAALTFSRDEVAEMTRSRTRAGQCKFLASNHIKFYRDAHGWPVVLRSTVEGGKASHEAPEWKPGKVA